MGIFLFIVLSGAIRSLDGVVKDNISKAFVPIHFDYGNEAPSAQREGMKSYGVAVADVGLVRKRCLSLCHGW